MESLKDNERFLQHESLLWRVLSKLARDGYPIPPSEARDLIHDFFLEWGPLNSRYESDKGEFTPYLATSFYRFARRRYFQLHHMRARITGIEELAELPSLDVPVNDLAETKEELIRLKEYLNKLSPDDRNLLYDYLSDETPGERELAAKYGFTRYRLREYLGELVGRIALSMSEHTNSLGADIAYRVWIAGESPRKIGLELGLPTEKIQFVKNRFVSELLKAARQTRSDGVSLLKGNANANNGII
jgi:RNA polymerase sigma factor (sigma-70 family)